MDDAVDAVEELRPERPGQLAQRQIGVGRRGGAAEADGRVGDDARADVGGEDDDAAAEVGGAAVGVGEPAGVEDLQTQIEDVEVRLLDLVEQQDDERPFAHHGGEQAGGAALADEAFVGLVSGVFAHVEADQPCGVAEQEFRHGAGQFGLADAGGADEQLHAERLVGVVQPGLDESHQIDDGVDGLGLAHDAGLEEGADLAAVERHGVVEEVDAARRWTVDDGFEDGAVVDRFDAWLRPAASSGRGAADH